MSAKTEQIRSDALNLPIHERARLAEELIASLDEDAEMEAAWAEVIERRIAEVHAGKVTPVDGDEVIARLRARLQQ